MLGAILIIAAGLIWYFAYVRPRVEREGVARGELRRRLGERAIARTTAAFEREGEHELIVVAVTESMDPRVEQSLVTFGAAVAEDRDGQLTVVRFDEVPDQLPLDSARERLSPSDVDFEAWMNERRDAFDVPMAFGEIVSHDTERAIANFADHHDADLLVTGTDTVDVDRRLVGPDLDWLTQHAPSDLLMVDTASLDEVETVALVTDQDATDPLKLRVADAIAKAIDATVELVQTPEPHSDEPRESGTDVHDELVDVLSAPADSRTLELDDPSVVATTVNDAELVVVGSDDVKVIHQIDDDHPDDLRSEASRGVVVTRSRRRRSSNPFTRLLDRLAS